MKGRIYLPLIAQLLLFCHSLSGQNTFQKTYGGGIVSNYGLDVLQAFDSCYILAGFTSNYGAGNQDMYLIKINTEGDTLWTRVFGTAADDRINSITQTTDGGFVLNGLMSNETCLMKTDASGFPIWSRNYGIPGSIGSGAVQQTADGGFIVTGHVPNPPPQLDCYLLKTDSAGNTQWSKTYGESTLKFVSSCVKQTNDHGYVVAGSFTGTPTNYDMFLIKTDSIGDTLWTRSYGGPLNDYGNSVLPADDGGYFLLGSTHSFLNPGIYLIKTDSVGIPLWSKTYEGTIQNGPNTRRYTIRKTNDSGYIIFAEWVTVSDLFLIKIDSTGNVIWANSFGGSGNEFIGSGLQTVDGGYIMIGTTNSLGVGNYDFLLIKTDSLGNGDCNETNQMITPFSIPNQLQNTSITISTPLFTNTPSNYSVAGGSVLSTICSSVGLPDIKSHDMHITPNPSGGNFQIKFSELIVSGNIKIVNALGMVIYSDKIFNESVKDIEPGNISEGIYLLSVFDGEKYHSCKLVFERD
ncbi:MAG TPA: T9SS type A sorting domain-containing protein [Bacteroidia bacterium]|nr:T9SS type A sorting domain-containing protein [Bacteroidia bacterium]